MFKVIKQDIQDFIRWWREFIFTRRHSIRLALAIRLAEMKQKAWNKQYFIILSSSDKLISINNDEVERLKRLPRYTKKQLKLVDEKMREREEEQRRKMITDGVDDTDRRMFMYDMKLIREKTLLRFKRMRLLPKELDGMRLRKTAFYYTPLKWNNDPGMTPEQRKEAKVRYLNYARKYMK